MEEDVGAWRIRIKNFKIFSKHTQDTMSLLDFPQNFPALLNFITISDKRKTILFLLKNGPKTFEELKDSLSTTAPALTPQLKKMINKGIIYKDRDIYTLTEKGEIIAMAFYKFARLLAVLEYDRKFWDEHMLSGIPLSFCLRLDELGNYRIIRSTPEDISRPHREFIRNLFKSKWIKGVSPIFYPDYPSIFVELCKKSDVSLVITEKIFKLLKKEFINELKEFIKYSELFVCNEDIKVAFAVTDVFLSLGLFLKSGEYDALQDLISFDSSAIQWGKELFDYYKHKSKKIIKV